MRFRWKLLLLLILIGLVPILAMRTFGARAAGRLRDVLVSQTTETLIVNAESRLKLMVDSYAQVLGQSREMFEMALAFQANQLEQSFGHSKWRESRLFTSDDFSGDDTTGSAEASAAAPERLLSEYREKQKDPASTLPLIQQVPGLTQDDLFDDIFRLASLAPFYRKLSSRLENFSVRHYTYLTSGIFSASAVLAVIIAGLVGGDCEQPRLEPPGRIERIGGIVYLEECFLDHVLRRDEIPRESQHEALEFRRVTANQKFETGRLPVQILV